MKTKSVMYAKQNPATGSSSLSDIQYDASIGASANGEQRFRGRCFNNPKASNNPFAKCDVSKPTKSEILGGKDCEFLLKSNSDNTSQRNAKCDFSNPSIRESIRESNVKPKRLSSTLKLEDKSRDFIQCQDATPATGKKIEFNSNFKMSANTGVAKVAKELIEEGREERQLDRLEKDVSDSSLKRTDSPSNTEKLNAEANRDDVSWLLFLDEERECELDNDDAKGKMKKNKQMSKPEEICKKQNTNGLNQRRKKNLSSLFSHLIKMLLRFLFGRKKLD
ncbi:MAG: hypothetical protein KTR16_05810 [Acidiferrobacterales bacterium]|nr:hypothetical protein [Acidiferrobacterales bacterium]